MTHKERYAIAGGAALELIKILGAKPTRDNFRLWAWYCYHYDIGLIHDRAYECVSRHRQGEIRDPVKAFHIWLSRRFPKRGRGLETASTEKERGEDVASREKGGAK